MSFVTVAEPNHVGQLFSDLRCPAKLPCMPRSGNSELRIPLPQLLAAAQGRSSFPPDRISVVGYGSPSRLQVMDHGVRGRHTRQTLAGGVAGMRLGSDPWVKAASTISRMCRRPIGRMRPLYRRWSLCG